MFLRVYPVLLALTVADADVARPVPPTIGMANPAAVNCIRAGGTLMPRRDARGEDANCRLPDGRVLNQWQYFLSTQDRDGWRNGQPR